MKSKQWNLYRVRFDGSDTFVEAGTMSAAIRVWHAYAVMELDVDEDAEPEEVALLESDDLVLREPLTIDEALNVARDRLTDKIGSVDESTRDYLRAALDHLAGVRVAAGTLGIM
jgi:hypothetical protein